MRRKLNPQTSEYVQNGELICFGISEHVLEEQLPNWSPQAQNDLAILRSWFPRGNMEEVTRPVYRSDFNWTNYASRAQLRCALGLAVIRELPIKSFYARCVLAYGYIVYFIIRGVGRGLKHNRPIVMYNHSMNAKALANYPDLFYWSVTRVLPTSPPQPDAHREWRTRQNPVYHQYHKNVYRYRFRKSRYVQWDGTQNQPVMPFLHDHGTEVSNGTFKRNCNTGPQLK